MIKTISISATVPPNREVKIVLPDDVPPGPAEITIIVAAHSRPKLATLGDLARSKHIGIWKHRTDIIDSAVYARDLRSEAWRRSG